MVPARSIHDPLDTCSSMGKMLRIHILDISTKDYDPLELKLDEEHRGAQSTQNSWNWWADCKSKIAATAAILKINFRHLFPNLWSIWVKTCSVATGKFLDQNELHVNQVNRKCKRPSWKSVLDISQTTRRIMLNLTIYQQVDVKMKNS